MLNKNNIKDYPTHLSATCKEVEKVDDSSRLHKTLLDIGESLLVYIVGIMFGEYKKSGQISQKLETVNSLDEFKDLPYVILDCAGHSALIEYASKALLKGIHFITLSSGALCDDEISDQIKTSSENLK